jgi:hypothetical protein
MKTMILLSGILFSAMAASAQSDSWKIYFNKKLLLSASSENESINIVTLSHRELAGIGNISIEYTEGNPNKEWKRTIALLDEKDAILFEKAEVMQLKITTADLRKWTKGKNKIKVYTWAIPKDPAKAALVRVRRVHLCTIAIK